MPYDNRNDGYRRDQPREFFKATCSDCGKECDVPFKPTQGRPVFCRDCFKNHRPEERPRRGPRF